MTRITINLGHLKSKPFNLVGTNKSANYQYSDGPCGCAVAAKCTVGSTSASAAGETCVFFCVSDRLSDRSSGLNIFQEQILTFYTLIVFYFFTILCHFGL